MFMFEVKDKGWWYWLITVCFLTAGVMGYSQGFIIAIGITLVQLVHYLILERRFSAFPVQVRTGYLLLLLVSWIDPLQWLYWVPTIGTWAQVIFGYCAMARIVSLMPWNRGEALSLRLLSNTFLSAPVRGSVKQGFAEIKEA